MSAATRQLAEAPQTDDRSASAVLPRPALLQLLREKDQRIVALEHEAAGLRAALARLRADYDRLRADYDRLRAEHEALGGERPQPAPADSPKPPPKPRQKPGRKPGRGPFSRRLAPALSEVTERLEAVLPECCNCGGTFELVRTEQSSITELPAHPKPEVTLFDVPVGRCRSCGKTERGRHPRLAPDQHGATAHRLGLRALATAHALHYGLGLTVRKVPRVLEALTGLKVTAGALTQDAERRTERAAGREYQHLREEVARAPVVHADDTGWKIGGQPAQLMGFATEDTTVYQIRDQHRNEEVREVLTEEFAGTLVTDRGRSYDAAELADVPQQKCLFHARNSITEVVEAKTGRGKSFGKQLWELLLGALVLWHQYHDGEVPDLQFAVRRSEFEQELTEYLQPRKLPDKDNQRLLNEFGWHHRRGNLLRFLQDPRVSPTNNRAEQELRPAVIARKVSQCSKTRRGAEAHACLTSLCRTLERRDRTAMVENLALIFEGKLHLASM